MILKMMTKNSTLDWFYLSQNFSYRNYSGKKRKKKDKWYNINEWILINRYTNESFCVLLNISFSVNCSLAFQSDFIQRFSKLWFESISQKNIKNHQRRRQRLKFYFISLMEKLTTTLSFNIVIPRRWTDRN